MVNPMELGLGSACNVHMLLLCFAFNRVSEGGKRFVNSRVGRRPVEKTHSPPAQPDTLFSVRRQRLCGLVTLFD